MYVRKEEDYMRFDNGAPQGMLTNAENMPFDQTDAAEKKSIRCDISIDLPFTEEESKIKTERYKTFLALVFGAIASVTNFLVLSYIHDRVPPRTVAPLPDILHDLLPVKEWGIEVSEVVIITGIWTTFIMMLLHKYRWVIFRRFFIIVGIIYCFRAITMLVTQVPVPSPSLVCSPQEAHVSLLTILKRFLKLASGLGLSINGQHTFCGDYIFSGHTLVLVLCYLFIRQYTPRNCRILHAIVFVTNFVGILMVLIARAHYTIDVFLGYYFTTRIFWMYHGLTSSEAYPADSMRELPVTQFVGRAWWYYGFRFFESGVPIAVPNEYDWPFPWPKKWAPRLTSIPQQGS